MNLVYRALSLIKSLQVQINNLAGDIGALAARINSESSGRLHFSTGSGSPEGVVTGSPGDTYWDTSSEEYYIKITGTATNTGWTIH